MPCWAARAHPLADGLSVLAFIVVMVPRAPTSQHRPAGRFKGTAIGAETWHEARKPMRLRFKKNRYRRRIPLATERATRLWPTGYNASRGARKKNRFFCAQRLQKTHVLALLRLSCRNLAEQQASAAPSLGGAAHEIPNIGTAEYERIMIRSFGNAKAMDQRAGIGAPS